MNREEAIYWLRLEFDEQWPQSTKWVAPEGWRWVVSHNPHQDYVYKLINANHSEINKEDVHK